MGILSVCMCLPNICTWGQQRVEECVILPGTGVLDNFELLCECLNLNSGPLREQPVLLPGEPPLQPQPRASHPLASTSTGEITGITVMPRFNSMLGNDFRVLFILRQALYQLRYFPAHWWFKKKMCVCVWGVHVHSWEFRRSLWSQFSPLPSQALQRSNLGCQREQESLPTGYPLVLSAYSLIEAEACHFF